MQSNWLSQLFATEMNPNRKFLSMCLFSEKVVKVEHFYKHLKLSRDIFYLFCYQITTHSMVGWEISNKIDHKINEFLLQWDLKVYVLDQSGFD